jgi:hypothetical protein
MIFIYCICVSHGGDCEVCSVAGCDAVKSDRYFRDRDNVFLGNVLQHVSNNSRHVWDLSSSRRWRCLLDVTPCSSERARHCRGRKVIGKLSETRKKHKLSPSCLLCYAVLQTIWFRLWTLPCQGAPFLGCFCNSVFSSLRGPFSCLFNALSSAGLLLDTLATTLHFYLLLIWNGSFQGQSDILLPLLPLVPTEAAYRVWSLSHSLSQIPFWLVNVKKIKLSM